MRPPKEIDDRLLVAKLADPQFVQDLQSDPKKALEQVTSGTPLQTDVWIYRIVVLALGLTVLMAVGGAIYLAASAGNGQTVAIPEILVAIGSAAVGALAGLLAPAPGTSAAG